MIGDGLDEMKPRPFIHNHVIDLQGADKAKGTCYVEVRLQRGGTSVSVRLEVLNMLNQVQWAAPASNQFGNSAFAQITNQATNMRMYQFTFRFQF